MDFVIIMAIVCVYLSLSSKLDKLINNQVKDSKNRFPSLKELIGKNISIETRDQLELTIDSVTTGKLKEFNDKWLVLETINKKKQRELYYYRLNNIISINVIE